MFSVISLTGQGKLAKPRLKNNLGNLEYVSFNNSVMLIIVKEKPNIFLKHIDQLIIDDVQYDLGLFSHIRWS